jgi:hypothetical protein
MYIIIQTVEVKDAYNGQSQQFINYNKEDPGW